MAGGFGSPDKRSARSAELGYVATKIVEASVNPPRTAFVASSLPRVGLALATGIAALAQASPAHALGGGLTISQPDPPVMNSPTNIKVSAAQTLTRDGKLASITNGPFDLDFALIGSLQADGWSDVGGIPFFEFSGSSLYTALSGSPNILTGGYIQANTAPSILRVYRNGLIDFEIVSAVNNPPSNCYTGKLITDAAGDAGTCQPFLKVLSVETQTGITGQVPTSAPGTLPTVGSLLKNFQGTSNAIGSLSGSGAEDKATF